MASSAEIIKFGPFEVTSQVFLKSAHSFALVNIRPILPGHVLVCPLAPRARLLDLSGPELADLWATVQRVQKMLGRRYFAGGPPPAGGSFNVALQDGPAAGQTVPHLHVHVFPRPAELQEGEPGTQGDRVYAAMEAEEGNVGGALWDSIPRPAPGGGFGRVDEVMGRPPRGRAEMEQEAEEYRALLREMGDD